MSTRPDESVMGMDIGIGADETVVQVEGGGCVKCHRKWPAVKFSKVGEAIAAGDQSPELICDSCQTKTQFTYGQTTSPIDGGPVLTAETDIERKTDEAQGTNPRSSLRRAVQVCGIESKSNVTGFEYNTHEGHQELTLTMLTVFFKVKSGTAIYEYLNVPVAICEAWYAASAYGESFGQFFAQMIKNSYEWRKA